LRRLIESIILGTLEILNLDLIWQKYSWRFLWPGHSPYWYWCCFWTRRRYFWSVFGRYIPWPILHCDCRQSSTGSDARWLDQPRPRKYLLYVSLVFVLNLLKDYYELQRGKSKSHLCSLKKVPSYMLILLGLFSMAVGVWQQFANK
jgi:hypothetical protein